MNAWKSKLVLSGIITATALLSGCEELRQAKFRAGVGYGIASENGYINGRLDLDMPFARQVNFENRTFNFYPTQGGMHDPLNGEFIRSDNPVWNQLGLPTAGTTWGGATNEIAKNETTLIGTVFIFPTWETLLEASTSEVTIILQGSGEMAVPFWDVDRWPTLNRTLYVFPNGIRASVDPINIEVSGNACDVFGYLAEFGLLNIDACINDSNWFVIVNENNSTVEIFVENILLTTFALPN
jgi:hypothetical protein